MPAKRSRDLTTTCGLLIEAASYLSSTFSRRSLARYATPTGLLQFASADSRFSLEEGILASAPARVIAVGWAAQKLVKRLDRNGPSRRTCSTLVW